MNHTIKKIFSVATLLGAVALHADCSTSLGTITDVTPLFLPRSQSVNAAMELAGWTGHVNLFDKDCFYGTLAITPGYSRSFRGSQIAECLFGTSSCDDKCADTVIKISGSRVQNRNATDWLADNFYLAPDFESTIKFSPRIQNAFLDFNLYLGLDEWANGLFFRAHAPMVWTQWDLNMCESKTTGTQGYEIGYFAPTAVPAAHVLKNFTAYAKGGAITSQDDITFYGLQHAKMDRCQHTKTGLADLRMILGWNFVNDEDYHLGVGVLLAAPTGNAPQGEFLFEPIVGNGKFWELGAHITGHAMLWRCESEESSLGFYVDANITHLFKSRQTRFFDLKNKNLSRYMLAERVDGTNTANQLTGATTSALADGVFNNEYTPVANLTTQDVDVSIGVQGDVAAQFTYAHGNWNWDVGYNFWGRSCENIKPDCNQNCSKTPAFTNDATWALKGDAQVFGYQGASPVKLSATESLATIYAGTNQALPPLPLNNGINSPEPALFAANPVFTQPGGATAINTSIQPQYIKAADFNLVGTRGISNKLYTHVSYNWFDCEDWVPYMGIGASAEWANNGSENNDCATDCENACVKCALSQWSVWAKLGVSFN